MRARSATRLAPPTPAAKINVTPMIDVVMCLIVFFLIVGQMAARRHLPVDLPDGPSGTPPAGKELAINVVPAEGGVRVVVEQVELTPEGTAEAVRLALAADPNRPVVLRASRRLTLGEVRPVIDACRAAGAPRLRLAGL
ncbi:MAG: biopolymer transporter ExbD [Phycisphaerales bacterium]|nr:biopolymer transporter ExbD [Phycisphaerales bacterium]